MVGGTDSLLCACAPPGTIIFVTDGAWDDADHVFTMNSTPGESDGLLRYVFPADTPAGTILTWDETVVNAGWQSVGVGTFDLNPTPNEGDQLFVFTVQTVTFPDFLFAFDTTRDMSNPAGWEADLPAVVQHFQSEVPQGLTAYVVRLRDVRCTPLDCVPDLGHLCVAGRCL